MSVLKNILKGTSILSSAALMTSFVAYKSGAFKEWGASSSTIIESYNNFPPDSLKKDSTNLSNDSLTVDPLLMPTSKSGVIFTWPDTSDAKEIEDYRMMGSSKSLRVWEPKDSNLLIPTIKDTSIKATPKQSNSNGNIQNKK